MLVCLTEFGITLDVEQRVHRSQFEDHVVDWLMNSNISDDNFSGCVHN